MQPELGIPTTFCSDHVCPHSFYNPLLSESQQGYKKMLPNPSTNIYQEDGSILSIYKMSDDITFGDSEVTIPQAPFQLITNYKTKNNDIWESFIGLAPKYYGHDNSFVTLLEKH